MATLTKIILKFKPIVKIPIVVNHAYFTVFTLSWTNSFAYISSIILQQLYDSFIEIKKVNLYQSQKDFHQRNLSFACVQFFKHNCLNALLGNIFLGNIFYHKQIKYQ